MPDAPYALEVKTCGLADEATVDVAVEAGATHLGFVHFPRSPRHLEPDAIARLVRHTDGRARTVVVTVDADDATLDVLVDAGIDMVQLHGTETPERVAAVTRHLGRPVVKAVAVADAADLVRARGYDGLVHRLLLDAKAPPGARLPGGNGVGFDHALLAGWDGGPFWLAGGLTPDNAAEAVRRVRPAGLDLSSGIERAPGEKDPALIRRLFANLASARSPAGTA